MGLVVGIPVLAGALVPMMCSGVCVPLRFVPLPGRPSTGGSASDISLVRVSRAPVLREWLLPEVSFV